MQEICVMRAEVLHQLEQELIHDDINDQATDVEVCQKEIHFLSRSFACVNCCHWIL